MSKPNILFIMSDDHAANAISCYGSRLAKHTPTPNIDRIAEEGVRMDNCHCTNSICTPSRASILTGQHSHINGVKTLSDSLPENATLLSELLQEQDYQTAIFGKWHLKSKPRGFDSYAILPGQGLYHDPIFCYPDKERAASEDIVNDIEELPYNYPAEKNDLFDMTVTREKGYVTDLITDKTLEWLDQRDEDKPFFLCCHHKAPHDFFEYKQQYEDLFDGVEFEEPTTLFEDDEILNNISRKYGSTVSERWEPRNMVKHLSSVDYPNGGPVDFSGLDFRGRARKAYQKYMRDYLRTVRSIDDNVGRILDRLDELGLTDNTIVIYTSDQGMMLGEHDKIDKRWVFDESQRMPLLIRYPKGINAGAVNDDMIDNTDFAPTFLDYAGIEAPKQMQGRSFRSLLEGQTPSNWRQSVYYRYWMHMAHHWVPAHYGIRTQNYKLIFFYGLKLDATGCGDKNSGPTEPGFELYDLANDPYETENLYGKPKMLKIEKQLKEELLSMKEFYEDLDDVYPELMEVRNRLW